MKITINEQGLELVLEGMEKFWSLRSRIVIPANHITSVHYEEEFTDWRKWEMRAPGTGAPGLLVAGSFWTEQGWDFLYLRRPKGFWKPRIQNVLVIETDLKRYKRIIVTCDPEAAREIIKAFKTD